MFCTHKQSTCPHMPLQLPFRAHPGRRHRHQPHRNSDRLDHRLRPPRPRLVLDHYHLHLRVRRDLRLRASVYWSFSTYWYNPVDVGHDLVRAALRILQDQSGGLFDPDAFLSPRAPAEGPLEPRSPPGLFMRLVRRFVLGLPVVGAGSLVHMLLSLPVLAPVQWLARFRGGRSRRNTSTRDAAAIVIIILLVVGIVRTIVKVYQFTETLSKRLLLRAEDIILEV
ncbi:hypothetical protein EW146_g9083 [Bondarzewia mesenterica]|uniref:Uncharacterized protein n=1 Tax=Bondarzewia mesenterica TaxID=1095465 RepID=A0A4V3XD32_9AGAM|nr:hypothetical protein EW146_g9083 [Bondarzewia mesenterica]